MKKTRNFQKLIGCLIFVASISLLSSCTEEDLCEDVTCLNNGIPTEQAGTCNCVCTAGYEGEDCGTLSRDKFIGTFLVSDVCSSSGASTYTTITSASGTDVDKVLISNVWDSFQNSVTATIDENTITIATQEPDGDGFTVSGSGTISGNVISLTYTVIDTSNNDTDNCQGTWTKQ